MTDITYYVKFIDEDNLDGYNDLEQFINDEAEYQAEYFQDSGSYPNHIDYIIKVERGDVGLVTSTVDGFEVNALISYAIDAVISEWDDEAQAETDNNNDYFASR